MAGSDQNDAGHFVALALLMVRFPYEDIPGLAINAKVATESCEQCRQKLVSRLCVTATGRDAARACASEPVCGQGGSSREGVRQGHCMVCWGLELFSSDGGDNTGE